MIWVNACCIGPLFIGIFISGERYYDFLREISYFSRKKSYNKNFDRKGDRTGYQEDDVSDLKFAQARYIEKEERKILCLNLFHGMLMALELL